MFVTSKFPHVSSADQDLPLVVPEDAPQEPFLESFRATISQLAAIDSKIISPLPADCTFSITIDTNDIPNQPEKWLAAGTGPGISESYPRSLRTTTPVRTAYIGPLSVEVYVEESISKGKFIVTNN